MTQNLLVERISFQDANIRLESIESGDQKSKTYFMEGIFIQGDKKNHNGRVYPKSEITSAVNSINQRMSEGLSILGEVDHPSNLTVNLDRVSHVITEMRMQGSDGVGKLKIIEDMPMGKICKTLLSTGVKLGVSSRGTGEVDHNGNVRNFDIVTVDIVAQPSAPDAYPKAIMEALEGYRRANMIIDLAGHSIVDHTAQKYLQKEIINFIKTL